MKSNLKIFLYSVATVIALFSSGYWLAQLITPELPFINNLILGSTTLLMIVFVFGMIGIELYHDLKGD